MRSLCSRPTANTAKNFPPTPQGSSARIRACQPAHTRMSCLQPLVRQSPCSRPPPSPTRRLRRSRRLSRRPSAPERTINVLHRRRRGRTSVLSGAEASRRSHRRLAGRRLQPLTSPAVPSIVSAVSVSRHRATPENLLISGTAPFISENRAADVRQSRESCFGSRIDPYSPAPARHTCRACAEAHPTRLRRVQRLSGAAHNARHPWVRPDVRLSLRSYATLCVPP